MLLFPLFALFTCAPAPQTQTEKPTESDAADVRFSLAPTTKGSLRWSPKGEKVPLKKEGDKLVGLLRFDFKNSPTTRLELERTQGSSHFDRLSIDSNRDGLFSASERHTTEPTERRQKWWSSFSTAFEVNIIAPGGMAEVRPYPVNLWYVEDPIEPDASPVIRFSRTGWMQGTIEIDGQSVTLILAESHMDGEYRANDQWALGATPEEAGASKLFRNLDDFTWLGEQAYRLVDVHASGLEATLRRTNPGITRKEDLEARDRYAQDKRAKRAKKPVTFGHDFEAAESQAKEQQKPLFIDFETTWCGPCKQMDALVYTAQVVVDAAQGVISVKVDGDERKDLAKRFGVNAYPTLILLSPEGGEIRRAVGYQSVQETQKLLAGDGDSKEESGANDKGKIGEKSNAVLHGKVRRADGAALRKDVYVSREPQVMHGNGVPVDKETGRFQLNAERTGPTPLYVFVGIETLPRLELWVDVPAVGEIPVEVLVPTHPIRIEGRISIEGWTPPFPRIVFQEERLGGGPTTAPREDGSFEVETYAPGRYRVFVNHGHVANVAVYPGMGPLEISLPNNRVQCTNKRDGKGDFEFRLQSMEYPGAAPAGTAPGTYRNVPPGLYWASLSAKGRIIYFTQVAVTARGQQNLQFDPSPPGRLWIGEPGGESVPYSLQSQGGFVLPTAEAYPPGSYRVYASVGERCGLQRVEILAGKQTRQHVTLEAASRWELQGTGVLPPDAYLVHSSGYRFQPQAYWGTLLPKPVDAGCLRFEGLPAGTYELRYRVLEGQWQTQEVLIKAGEPTQRLRLGA